MEQNDRKEKLISRISVITTTLSLIVLRSKQCFAEGIGIAEVKTATENIQRVITSIAMPLRWCFDFCKYCSSCNKNDCKRK